MTHPRHILALTPEAFPLGRVAFRSWILLFGVVPVDYDDITLVELAPGRGFREASRMMLVREWRHSREVSPEGAGCCSLRDEVALVPRWRLMGPLLYRVYRLVFALRHCALRRMFGGGALPAPPGVVGSPWPPLGLTPPLRNRLLVLLAAVVLTGICLLWPRPPEKWTDVSGTVRYKGKALGGGTIQFLGSDGATYPAKIGSDGTYRARVRVGQARVLVSCVDEARMVEYLQKPSDFTRGNKAGVAPQSQSFSLIPEKYAAWSTSGLKVTIQGGKNTHDFDLP
jgi:hypothetical protein